MPDPALAEIETALVRAAVEVLGAPPLSSEQLARTTAAVHTALCRLFPGINGLTTPRDFSQTT